MLLAAKYNFAMKTRGLYAGIVWLAVAYPCAAQLMGASEYHDYMKGLDASAQRWQREIKAIDVAKMNLDYSSGKTVEHARRTIVENLKFMRNFIEQQRSTEMLSVDISIENTIGDASAPLSVLLDMLPPNQEGVYWQRTLPAINSEMTDLQVQLRKHIDAYANKLQLEATRCSK
jgi:hypothetical protein